MKKEEKIFKIEDIYMAFNMGLDSAVFVLEISRDMSDDDREYLLECLKRFTGRNKAKTLKGSRLR